MFILKVVQIHSRPYVPVSCRMTLILTVLPLLQGSDRSEASQGSNLSEGHNLSQIKAANPALPGARNAIGCPLTCPLRAEKKKLKALLTRALEGQQPHSFEAKADMKVSSQHETGFCFYPSLSVTLGPFLAVKVMLLGNSQREIGFGMARSRLNASHISPPLSLSLVLTHNTILAANLELNAANPLKSSRNPPWLFIFIWFLASWLFALPWSISHIAFLQPCVIKLGGGGVKGSCLNV